MKEIGHWLEACNSAEIENKTGRKTRVAMPF